MRRVTIKDIAKIAGVSYATVSRALSGSSEISEATRVRVVEICKQEGYRANSLARSLICNKTNVIGLIVPAITNPFYSEIALGIETCAHALGYNVILCNSRYDDARVDSLFEFLMGHQVDGIILATTRGEACDRVSQYFKTVPTVLLGDAPARDVCNTVSVDNRAGGRMGTQYLHALGHDRIVYLGARPASPAHQQRAAGYAAEMERLGLPPAVLENPWGSSDIAHGYALGKQLFADGYDCTAIFAATDSMALGVLQAADERGIDIPGEVSLLGFDNISYSALPKIALSTIDQRKQLLSEAAVHRLVDMIDKPDDAQCTHQTFAPSLVERRSCRKLK